MSAPQALVRTLTDAARAAFDSMRSNGERFYFFALYTTEDGDYATATAWSEEALTRAGPEETRKRLRFSAPDSPFHDVGSERFDKLKSGPALHEACFEALAALDAQKFFGTGATRAKTILNVVYGDMSDERWLAHATRLNPRKALDAARPFLTINEPSGKVKTWGGRAYQVNALSFSADLRTVAYCGSGGELGVYRTKTRKPLYEPRGDHEHWACALSPDGTTLYLSFVDRIEAITLATRVSSPFAKTPKPHQLAISPDGRCLTSISNSNLIAFDTETRKRRFTLKGLTRCAFSPDGRWLAGVHDSKLHCVDAATGAAKWSTRIGTLDDLSLAWSPDSTELLAAASSWELTPNLENIGSSSLAFYSVKRGALRHRVPWASGVDAVAVAPNGKDLAICSDTAVLMLTRDGEIIGRGTGGQEALTECAFLDDSTVLAAGRNVNRGPALLELKASR